MLCARIVRLVQCLQPYNIKVVYQPGSQNINSLSRLTAIVKTQNRNEAEDCVKFVTQEAVPGGVLMS